MILNEANYIFIYLHFMQLIIIKVSMILFINLLIMKYPLYNIFDLILFLF